MTISKTVLDSIGNTPLIEYDDGSDSSQRARILMKAEYLNPSGSLKDRMAYRIIKELEDSGQLKPGGTVVEATAGNTGIAVAMICAMKGYKSVFTMPDKFSTEKINMLKAYGSQVITVPTNVPDDHPDSWKEVAKRVVAETPNSALVNQFYNLANVRAHYETTGPEIWSQTGGNIDAFISGAGSGGTISGVGKYLKEEAKKVGRDVKIILMDPLGSSYGDFFYQKGKAEKKPWKMEGIGNDFIPGCLDLSVVDEVRTVTDKQAFFYARRLARKQGLYVGETSGAGLALALDLAKELGPGKTVMFLLCDSGNRYLSKLYNDDWMKNNGFGTLGLELRNVTVGDVVGHKGREVIFADSSQTIGQLVQILIDKGISQVPVKTDKQGEYRIIHESDLLEALLIGEKTKDSLAIEVSKPVLGLVGLDHEVAKIEPNLEANNVVLAVDAQGEIAGIISRIDVVRYLSKV